MDISLTMFQVPLIAILDLQQGLKSFSSQPLKQAWGVLLKTQLKENKMSCIDKNILWSRACKQRQHSYLLLLLDHDKVSSHSTQSNYSNYVNLDCISSSA